ncbi:MAG TPA: nitroreductase family deazaflavin-dependent oxidoreductase [Thermomicrobiales bacterium]|nr:nitroreductase family deazaflavin-dependent oxidoreductase [Thermomicrobiales bacterium]
MSVENDWNARIIREFREHGGRAPSMEGSRLLLLHHTGARTGREHITPLMYQPAEDGYTVFATKGGAPTHPDWYYNLIAHPGAEIEVAVDGQGIERKRVMARVLEGEERDRIWAKQKQEYPEFATYEEKTDRVIPAVHLQVTN